MWRLPVIPCSSPGSWGIGGTRGRPRFRPSASSPCATSPGWRAATPFPTPCLRPFRSIRSGRSVCASPWVRGAIPSRPYFAASGSMANSPTTMTAGAPSPTRSVPSTPMDWSPTPRSRRRSSPTASAPRNSVFTGFPPSRPGTSCSGASTPPNSSSTSYAIRGSWSRRNSPASPPRRAPCACPARERGVC